VGAGPSRTRSAIPKSILTESLSASPARVAAIPRASRPLQGGALGRRINLRGLVQPLLELLQTLAEVAHHLGQATGPKTSRTITSTTSSSPKPMLNMQNPA